MATHEVSTWAQLVSAISSAANDDTIKLIKDIDCNKEIPEGVVSTVVLPIGINVTIDGSYEEDGITKNHEIRNLRTSVNSPVSIFKISRPNSSAITHTIKNIDFVNLILNKPLLDVEDYYTAIHTFNIRNCRFTGKRYDYLIKRLAGQDSGAQGYINVNIYSSYFNVPYYGTSSEKASLCDYYSNSGSYFRSYMYNCRIKESFNDTYTPDNTIYGGISNSYLDGCRVEGTLIGSALWDGTYHCINITRNAYTPAIQNVLDCDIYLNTTSALTKPKLNRAPLGVVKIPIYYKNDTQVSLESISSGIIAVTESQMQDTAELIQQGFDVVPST